MTNTEALATIAQIMMRYQHPNVHEASNVDKQTWIMDTVWKCAPLLKATQEEKLAARDELFQRYLIEHSNLRTPNR